MITIPTTLRLPQDLHEELRHEAFQKKTSLNDIMIRRLRQEEGQSSSKTQYAATKVKRDFALFDRIGKKYGLTGDAAQLVREERDRDNA